MANTRVMGLAKVTSGWAGSLSVTVGAATVAVGFEPITSPIVVAHYVAATVASFGITVETYANQLGHIYWQASSDFSYTASGAVRTKMNLAASMGPGTLLAGSGAHQDGVYPTMGMKISEPMLASSNVPALADGSGSPGIMPETQRLGIDIFGSAAEMWTREAEFAAGDLWDVWAANRYIGRLRIEDVQRVREGRLAGGVGVMQRLRVQGTSYYDPVMP